MNLAATLFPRRAVLVLGLLLSGCYGGNETAPQQFTPLSYSYLPSLKLNVARIDIVNRWAPAGTARHVEYLSPIPPVSALTQLARDRLSAGGSAGRAEFIVQDASIVQGTQTFNGSIAAQLVLLDDSGGTHGSVVARVQAVRPITDAGDSSATRADLYALTRSMMDSMNVELEYQIRHSLSGDLQATNPIAPAPPAVETQDLSAPHR